MITSYSETFHNKIILNINIELTKLIDYLVDTCLNFDVCKFERQMWNHFETERSRTINHLEGWHVALNGAFNRHKPNIFYLLVNEIKNQQQNFKLDLMAQKNENPMPKSKLKFQ